MARQAGRKTLGVAQVPQAPAELLEVAGRELGRGPVASGLRGPSGHEDLLAYLVDQLPSLLQVQQVCRHRHDGGSSLTHCLACLRHQQRVHQQRQPLELQHHSRAIEAKRQRRWPVGVDVGHLAPGAAAATWDAGKWRTW